MSDSTTAIKDQEAGALSAQSSAPVELQDFERIYKLYGGKVYRLCLHMVGNPADAEELTQDTFLQVFRKLDTYRGESAFSTWLHRVAVNVVLMRLRKNRGHSETPLEQVFETEEGEEFQATEAQVDDPRLIGAIDRLSLQRAILQLSLHQRLAFVLHDIEGYTHEEIAALLGCTVESSKYRAHAARLNMRSSLKEYQRGKRGRARSSSAAQHRGRMRQGTGFLGQPAPAAITEG
ncbi:MAG: RNA polymerase sigma factor [Acidobacteriota bacterium]|nr:RNA polymerase sigma factor [Acidobacteriota bacterium]